MDSKKFGKYIAELRKEKGWTQEELADKMCVSNKTISKWECGGGFPDIQSLEPLAQVLEISVTELIRSEKGCDELKEEDINAVVLDVFEVAQYQKRMERKNFVIAIILAILLIMIVFVLEQNSMFVILNVILPFVLFSVGIVLIFFSVRRKKMKKSYKAMRIIGIINLFAPLFPALFLIGCLCLLKLKDIFG